MKRDLTHEEIINEIDLGNGCFYCLCGDVALDELYHDDNHYEFQCPNCGRKYEFCIGVVAGEVIEPGMKEE